jgi:hypothetical protein
VGSPIDHGEVALLASQSSERAVDAPAVSRIARR